MSKTVCSLGVEKNLDQPRGDHPLAIVSPRPPPNPVRQACISELAMKSYCRSSPASPVASKSLQKINGIGSQPAEAFREYLGMELPGQGPALGTPIPYFRLYSPNRGQIRFLLSLKAFALVVPASIATGTARVQSNPYQLPIIQLVIVMAATTISVGRKTKEFLARKKKTMEEQQRGQLTWDQFFERLFASATPPQLTKEEAKELKRLVAEARPWKTRA